MGEWKRVFLSPRRAVLLAVMAFINVLLFVTSLFDYLEPGGFGDMLAAERVSARICREAAGMEPDEILELCGEYSGRLSAYYVSPEENEADIGELCPRFLDLQGDSRAASRLVGTLSNAILEIEDQAEYIKGYGAYLAAIQKQAATMSQVGIFNRGGGFSSENIARTARDYEPLEDVRVEFGNNSGLENWIAYGYADFFFLAAVVSAVLAFLEERRKGLWHVVRTCRDSRLRLAVVRLGILCAASAGAAAVFYGLPLCVSMAVSGGWDGLGRSVQSLSGFKNCTVVTSIGGWLVQFFALKVLCGVLLGLLIWCVLGSLANAQFSFAVLGVMLAGEYLLYDRIPAQSGLAVIKYINLFSYVRTLEWDTKYLNLNIFGHPVGRRPLLLGLLAVAAVALAVWAFLIQCRRRPEGHRDILSALALLVNRVLDRVRAGFSLGCWEMYKSLVYSSGIILMVVVFLASGSLSFRRIDPGRLPAATDPWYTAYAEDMEGPLDQRADDYLVRARQAAEDSGHAGEYKRGLDLLEQTVTDIRAKAAEGGYEPWLVHTPHYDTYYGDASRPLQRFNAAAAMLFLVLLCSPLMASELQAGVHPMLRSVKRGRGRVFARKAMVAALYAAFVWAVVYMRELSTVLGATNRELLGAPVQNLEDLAGFPVRITVGQYLACLYGVRLLMLVNLSFVILLLSGCAGTVRGAYFLNAGLLAAPAVLLILGLDAAKYLSPLVPVSSAELFWSMGGGGLLPALPWLLFLLLSAAALAAAYTRWSRPE